MAFGKPNRPANAQGEHEEIQKDNESTKQKSPEAGASFSSMAL